MWLEATPFPHKNREDGKKQRRIARFVNGLQSLFGCSIKFIQSYPYTIFYWQVKQMNVSASSFFLSTSNFLFSLAICIFISFATLWPLSIYNLRFLSSKKVLKSLYRWVNNNHVYVFLEGISILKMS